MGNENEKKYNPNQQQNPNQGKQGQGQNRPGQGQQPGQGDTRQSPGRPGPGMDKNSQGGQGQMPRRDKDEDVE